MNIMYLQRNVLQKYCKSTILLHLLVISTLIINNLYDMEHKYEHQNGTYLLFSYVSTF